MYDIKEMERYLALREKQMLEGVLAYICDLAVDLDDGKIRH